MTVGEYMNRRWKHWPRIMLGPVGFERARVGKWLLSQLEEATQKSEYGMAVAVQGVNTKFTPWSDSQRVMREAILGAAEQAANGGLDWARWTTEARKRWMLEDADLRHFVEAASQKFNQERKSNDKFISYCAERWRDGFDRHTPSLEVFARDAIVDDIIDGRRGVDGRLRLAILACIDVGSLDKAEELLEAKALKRGAF